MLIERLLMENLGVFRGQHSIELLPTDPRRPIVLVGALNGSGKTTIIEALQLALYGKRAGYGWRGAGSYPQYLEHIRNRDAKPTESTVAEVTLRLPDRRQLRVCRQWSFTKAQPREFLSVYLNAAATPDLMLSEAWDEEVERLLPARLSELFFFDGERIEKLADPAQSADVLRAAVASLLGLDLVDHLSADLEILKMRQKQKVLSSADEEHLQTLNAQYDAVCREREDLEQRRASLVMRLDRAQAECDNTDRRLREQGGDRFQQRERLTSEAAAERGRAAALEEQLRHLSAAALPLQFLRPLLKGLRDEAAVKASTTDGSASRAINNHLDHFLGWLARRKFPAKVKSDLREYARVARDRVATPTESEGDFKWANLNIRLGTLLTSGLKETIDSVRMLLNDLALSTERLHAVEEQLSQVPEQEQLAELLRAQGAAEAAVAALNAEAARLTTQLQSTDRSLKTIQQQRSELLDRATESGEAARLSAYCQRSIKTVAVFRANLVQRRREQLEQLILEAFQLLARKSDLVGRVKLDNETMAVSLLTPSGQELATQQLSAGERQLLAVAMLWGLARASGRPVPVVIDTPLGRLDGEHRRALVERYFPDASHQVILLSTDQEVDADFSDLLEESVAHRYLIGYDEASRSSAFSPGYFAG
jgi:DNA sulfur modification protein DndD